MDSPIRSIGDRGTLRPIQRDRRDRRAHEDDHGGFRRGLEELIDEDGTSLRDEIVVPHARRVERSIAPPTDDEVGVRVDVEA